MTAEKQAPEGPAATAGAGSDKGESAKKLVPSDSGSWKGEKLALSLRRTWGHVCGNYGDRWYGRLNNGPTKEIMS